MPTTTKRPPDGGLQSSPTTLCIVLIIVIPSILLVGICFARRTPLLASIPGNRYHAVRELTRPSKSSQKSKLQPMPVIRYSNKLSAALKQDLEAARHETDCEAGTSTEDLTVPDMAASDAHKTATQACRTSSWPRGLRSWMPTISKWKGSMKRYPTLGLLVQSRQATAAAVASAKLGWRRTAAQCCAICTEDFRPQTYVRRLPCAHIFHPRCIDPWLVDFATTCPLCRIDLRVKQETDAISEPPRAVVAADTEQLR